MRGYKSVASHIKQVNLKIKENGYRHKQGL